MQASQPCFLLNIQSECFIFRDNHIFQGNSTDFTLDSEKMKDFYFAYENLGTTKRTMIFENTFDNLFDTSLLNEGVRNYYKNTAILLYSTSQLHPVLRSYYDEYLVELGLAKLSFNAAYDYEDDSIEIYHLHSTMIKPLVKFEGSFIDPDGFQKLSNSWSANILDDFKKFL